MGRLLVALVLCVSVLPACRKKVDPGAKPEEHREVAATCSSAPGRGYAKVGVPGECSKDSDCKRGMNGRCVLIGDMNPARNRNACEYDDCFTDSDCHAHETCTCGFRSEMIAERHRCLPSNCRVDGDCGPNGFCSPSKRKMGSSTVEGWYCHTEDDECMNDADCPGARKMFEPYCGYSKKKERWMCDSQRYSD